jgi:hypothetical protein
MEITIEYSRPPLTEAAIEEIGRKMYPDWQPPLKTEGFELDAAMEQSRERRTNSDWVRDQTRKLHREFLRLREEK